MVKLLKLLGFFKHEKGTLQHTCTLRMRMRKVVSGQTFLLSQQPPWWRSDIVSHPVKVFSGVNAVHTALIFFILSFRNKVRTSQVPLQLKPPPPY